MANISEFLDAYFGGLKSREQTRQFNAEQARLAANTQAELSQRQAEQKQRADQFNAQQAFEKSKQDYAEKQNQQDRIDKFTLAGGMTQAAPTDQKFDFQTGGQQPAPAMDLSFLGAPKPAGQGPAAADMNPQAVGQNIIQGLPLQQSPAIPMQGDIPAAAQMPDPAHFQQVPNLMGGDKDKQYFAPTPLEQARQRKVADTEANQMEVPEWMSKSMPEYGLKPGQQMDRRDLPLLEKNLEYKQTMAQRASQFETTAAQKAKAESDEMFYKGMMLQLQAEKAGKSKVDEDAADSIAQSVIQTGDPSKIPSTFVGPVTKILKDKYDLPFPAAPKPGNTQMLTAATNVKGYIGNIKTIMSDPAIAEAIGPYLGRLDQLQQQIGKNMMFKNDPVRQAKLQDLMTQLNNVVASEVRTQIGGRASNQMFDAFKQTSPNVKMDLPMFMGALHGIESGANNTLKTLEHATWGDKETPNFKSKMGFENQKIDDAPAAWANSKDPRNYIPFGAIKPMPDPDHPGQKIKIYHSVEDDKFYKVVTQ